MRYVLLLMSTAAIQSSPVTVPLMPVMKRIASPSTKRYLPLSTESQTQRSNHHSNHHKVSDDNMKFC